VLGDELPHRDFDELYTGLLTLYHAAGFALFGASLATVRWMLLAAFALWVPLLSYVCERVAGGRGGALLVALCIAWSVPNYPAGMPSWYNLFLGTAAVAATFRYVDARRTRWLLVAGACVAVSALVKVVGLFTLAAVLLFLAYDEQLQREADASPSAGDRLLAGATVAGLAALLLVMGDLTARAGGRGRKCAGLRSGGVGANPTPLPYGRPPRPRLPDPGRRVPRLVPARGRR
jgi:hypothetical protein